MYVGHDGVPTDCSELGHHTAKGCWQKFINMQWIPLATRWRPDHPRGGTLRGQRGLNLRCLWDNLVDTLANCRGGQGRPLLFCHQVAPRSANMWRSGYSARSKWAVSAVSDGQMTPVCMCDSVRVKWAVSSASGVSLADEQRAPQSTHSQLVYIYIYINLFGLAEGACTTYKVNPDLPWKAARPKHVVREIYELNGYGD